MTGRKKLFGKRVYLFAGETPASRHLDYPIWYSVMQLALYVAVNELALDASRRFGAIRSRLVPQLKHRAFQRIVVIQMQPLSRPAARAFDADFLLAFH